MTTNGLKDVLDFGIFCQFLSFLVTLFDRKCHILIFFRFWHFTSIFVRLKLTYLVTLFDRKLQVFKKSPKWTIFGNFNELLATQNVNVARFARNCRMRLFLWFSNTVSVWVINFWVFAWPNPRQVASLQKDVFDSRLLTQLKLDHLSFLACFDLKMTKLDNYDKKSKWAFTNVLLTVSAILTCTKASLEWY